MALLQAGLQLVLLLAVFSITSLPGSLASNSTPQGCGPNVDSLYYNLCDLSAAWGIVLEAFAAAGVVATLVLLIVLLAILPFVTDKRRRASVGLHVAFLVCTLGLFALTFAFIVAKDFSTCISRRFLFGVLFAGCFACLLMQCVRVNILVRRNSGPSPRVLYLGALGLWMVEVIINTEWLIITVVSSPVNSTGAALAVPCNLTNPDFVMALIYVMGLLLAVVVAAVPTLVGRHKTWRKEGALILVTGLLSVGIWVAWIVMYVYGNGKHGNATWDDPTLAIALVANSWVFLLLYTVPEMCSLSTEEEGTTGFGEELYPSRSVGYENILKEQSAQSMFMENKAFSMDEPSSAQRPVSPYSGYNGQVRSSVYQPTELALISKGVGNPQQQSQQQQQPVAMSYEGMIPRASIAPPQAPSGRSSPSTEPDESPVSQAAQQSSV